MLRYVFANSGVENGWQVDFNRTTSCGFLHTMILEWQDNFKVFLNCYRGGNHKIWQQFCLISSFLLYVIWRTAVRNSQGGYYYEKLTLTNPVICDADKSWPVSLGNSKMFGARHEIRLQETSDVDCSVHHTLMTYLPNRLVFPFSANQH